MPKSKRSRIVHTSRVQKRPSKERSATIFADVQSAASTHSNVFVLRVTNMRNTFLQEIRAHFKPGSRLIFGKSKVMAKALGASEQDEAMPGMSGLTPYVKGGVGIMFTDRSVDEVQSYFEDYSELDYARAGVRATKTVVIPSGVVYSTGGTQPIEDDVPMAHSQEVTVRKWGMPTKLEKGKVILDAEYVLCEQGSVLNSNQTALLKLFGIPMAEFRVRVLAHWSAATGEVTKLSEDVSMDGEDEMEGVDEE